MFAVSHRHITPRRFIINLGTKHTKNCKEVKDAKDVKDVKEAKIIQLKTKEIFDTSSTMKNSNLETNSNSITKNSSNVITTVGIDSNLTSNTSALPGNNLQKRLKIKLSVIKDAPYQPNQTIPEKKHLKRPKEAKSKHKRVNREGNFNCGRWQPEEHQRFIEAILKFGNEWKQVQKHVGTRSSTQARSHAQKFFVKIKKANILDFNIDLSKNSIKTLHDLANSMNTDEYVNAIKALNCVAFERKNISKKKNKKDLGNASESDICINDVQSTLNLNDEIFSLNPSGEQSLFFGNTNLNLNLNLDQPLNPLNQRQKFINTTNSNTIKVTPPTDITEENNLKHSVSYQMQTQTKTEKINSTNNLNGNTIIINNNINTYNYNLNFNNCDVNKKEFLRKRHRLNSFEGLFSLFPNLEKDLGNLNQQNFRKNFDDVEYINNFNCTFKDDVFNNIKNDFNDEKEIEDMIMISNSQSEDQQMSRKVSNNDNFLFEFMNTFGNTGNNPKNNSNEGFHKTNTTELI